MGSRAGQHLTLRRIVEGKELRRTYSLCCERPPRPPPYRSQAARRRRLLDLGQRLAGVGRRRRGGGAGRPVPPAARSRGRPALRRHRGRERHHTDLLDPARRCSRSSPSSTAALWYGNKTTGDIMFLEELCDLKDRYADRFEVLFFLSREEQEVELLSGRIDGERG